MIRSFILSFFLLSWGLGFFSCYSVRQRTRSITIKSGQLPPDMSRESFTLMAFKGERGRRFDRKMAALFEKYTGKYAIITRGELESRYMNEQKYRYVLDFDMRVGHGISSTGHPESQMEYWCFILDRKYHKKYFRKHPSGLMLREAEAYLNAIEAIRRH